MKVRKFTGKRITKSKEKNEKRKKEEQNNNEYMKAKIKRKGKK